MRAAVPCLLFVVACYQPRYEDAEPGNDTDSIRSFFVDASQFPPCQPGEPLAVEEVHWRITTVSAGGRFAPRNVGAFWIESTDGAYVDTLEQWGTTRKKWLSAYNEATDGEYSDAVSGATRIRHEEHEGTWDLHDRFGCPVPPGAFVLRMELTDRSGVGPEESAEFKVGPAGSWEPPDFLNFTGISLRFE